MLLELHVDRRSRSFEQDDGLLARARAQARARREANIALARTLLEIKRRRAYAAEFCSSVEMYGRQLGLATHEVTELVRLGEAMEASDAVEERVRAKALSVPAAAALAPVLAEPELFGPQADWISRAEYRPFWTVRRETRKAIAEVRYGEPVQTIEVRVPDSVAERFDRARVLASRKAGRQLTRDETFEAVVDAYVDANDPLLVAERARRVGPTEENPRSRYIPVSVKREVRRRAGDRCEFPGCFERVHLEFAHRRPHREGSGREARDLFLLCNDHHFFQETRFVVPLGHGRDVVWVDQRGWVRSRERPGGRPAEDRREMRVLEAMRRRERARSRRQSCQGKRGSGDDAEGSEGGAEEPRH